MQANLWCLIAVWQLRRGLCQLRGFVSNLVNDFRKRFEASIANAFRAKNQEAAQSAG